MTYPDGAVGESSEPGDGLNRLVGGSILTESDGVVGGNPDDLVVRESGESDGTGGVRDEVEEGSAEGNDGTVGVETVHDGTHGVLSDTVSEVSTAVVSETSLGGLEVDGLLPSGEVGSSQVGRTTNELRKGSGEGLEDNLGVLPRSDGGISHLVDREVLLPALREVTRDSSSKLSSLGGVLRLVRLKKGVPLGVGLGTSLSRVGVELVNVLGNVEEGLRVQAELLLDGDNVVLLEGCEQKPGGRITSREEKSDFLLEFKTQVA